MHAKEFNIGHFVTALDIVYQDTTRFDRYYKICLEEIRYAYRHMYFDGGPAILLSTNTLSIH